MQPVISVIVPAYNAEKYIMQTLLSIRNQTYGGVIETIVVDDCSTDSTLEIALRYAQARRNSAFRPVKVIENEKNSGVAFSRNAAVRASSGEYICFLDSDDYWDETKIQAQIELLESISAKGEKMPALVCTGRECVDENGQSLGKEMKVKRRITCDDMLKTNVIPCSSVMLKREAALEFPMERDDLAEDYICWMKVIRKYGPAAGVNKPLLKYRIIQGSRSANKLKSAKMHYGALRHLGYDFFPAAGYLVSYAVNGIRKHKVK